ncbi:MAG: DUF4810 domain-containing protein [Dissulfurispiraceae bacterium]
MIRYLLLVIAATAFLLSACAHQEHIDYAWGSYSKTLYAYKKDPCNEKMQAHKDMLLKIISDSKERSIRVPPGVYAEYGYILLKEGRTAEGVQYLQLEAQTYPESQVFMQRLITQATTVKEPPPPPPLETPVKTETPPTMVKEPENQAPPPVQEVPSPQNVTAEEMPKEGQK